MFKLLITLILGFVFGSVLIASQAFTWHRIQEMFHFQSFHMFGFLFSAIVTAAISLWFIKMRKKRSVFGNELEITPKKLEWKANLFGGLIFGLGWSISGACSAPVFILAGFQWPIGVVLLLGAFVGTIIFALLESKLPRK
ncbi:MAG: DUF6691 family protein [Flavobacteriia bacterium]|jgi:uncharacterized membrane protein YedE/YeeE